jgi:hypothetical protein
MNHNLKMAFSYLEAWKNDLLCEEGEHQWSETSSYALYNIQDSKAKNYFKCHRTCRHCHIIMPESSEGEKNYVSWDDRSDSNFKNLLRTHKENADYINKSLEKIKTWQLIKLLINRLWNAIT